MDSTTDSADDGDSLPEPGDPSPEPGEQPGGDPFARLEQNYPTRARMADAFTRRRGAPARPGAAAAGEDDGAVARLGLEPARVQGVDPAWDAFAPRRAIGEPGPAEPAGPDGPPPAVVEAGQADTLGALGALPPKPSAPPAVPTWPFGRRRRPALCAVVAVVIAAVIALAALQPAGGPRSQGRLPGAAGPSAGAGGGAAGSSAVPPPVPVPPQAGQVTTVVLDTVSGQVRIGEDDRAQTVTGRAEVSQAGVLPSWETRTVDGSGGTALRLLCRLAATPAAAPVPCPTDITLTVPAGTAVEVRQQSGRVVLTGLRGSVTVSARSAEVLASDLRAARLTADVVAGSLDLAFAAPPQSLGISATASHATVRLPGCSGYAVRSEQDSGRIDSGVRADDASRSLLQLQAVRAEVRLLPTTGGSCPPD